MELPLSSPAKCELRSVIRFLNAKNNSPVLIHRQEVEVYGEKCMDIKNVRKWCREFNEGRINVQDEQRSGRPSLPESTVARIDEMVRANRRITLEEIEDGLNEDCSHFSVHKIVSETLGYRKVSARSVLCVRGFPALECWWIDDELSILLYRTFHRERLKMEYPGENLHFRHLLFFLFHRGQKAAEAARDISNVYGKGVIGERAAQKWFAKFKNGDRDLENTPRSGRPSEFDEEHLKALMKED
ncbi:hypothetical protein LAZ67_8001560, partial [Cordylochernes scorpioides]